MRSPVSCSRHPAGMVVLLAAILFEMVLLSGGGLAQDASATRVYANTLVRLKDPPPLLNDHPEFVQPIIEEARFEAPILVDDPDADLTVRAWRFSYIRASAKSKPVSVSF